MSSRVVRDEQGRMFVEVTTPVLGARRYRVVGDQVAAGGTEISFTGGKTIRREKPAPPAPREPGPDGWLVGDVAEYK